MSYSEFNVDAALRGWQEKIEAQKAAALADPNWKGREAQLAIQLDLGQVLAVVTSATMKASNDGKLSTAEIAGCIGLAMGSVLFFIQKNFGELALLKAVKEMERALDVHTSGELPQGGLMTRHSVHAMKGGRA